MTRRDRKLYIAYYRVSTDRQGKSGLGIEAQQKLVRDFCGDDWPPVAEFTEVASGKKDDRTQLNLALAECRRRGAALVIAKLDRLSRRLSFIAVLMDTGVEFFVADMPHADRFRIHLEAVIAEDERRRISERTTAALAAAKARGVKLGGDHGGRLPLQAAAEGRELAAKARATLATQEALAVLPAIKAVQASGINSASGIARALNDRGIPARAGGKWQAVQVQRVLSRVTA
jgi:DNA invertase Pin-like site-specific DNA recombinase